MPEILDKLSPRNTSLGEHPWEEWLDGRARRFVLGVDFHHSTRAFRQAAYRAAHALGRRAVTRAISASIIELQGKPARRESGATQVGRPPAPPPGART